MADPYGLRPHFPIEIRFSDGDDIWLSPSNGKKTCWIGIIQYKQVFFPLHLTSIPLTAKICQSITRPYASAVPYKKLFSHFESILARHGGRPHWAKAHSLRPDDLRLLYPRFDDFVRVLEEVDPTGMFRNEYVQRHIFGRQEKEFGGRVFKPFQSSARW